MATQYFVVPAPGYYGDTDRVRSSHRTLRAARRQLRRGLEVREGRFARGDRWLRVYAETYPLVARWGESPET